MLPYFQGKFGNASSVNHAFGWDAEEAVDLARAQVAALMGASPKEIYFTSGATEALNLALIGACEANISGKKHLITAATEHKAVHDTCAYLEKRGYRVTYLPVDASGQISLSQLADALSADTLLVSLMAANNETGVLHPLSEIANLTRQAGALFLTDATQALGKIPFHVHESGVDLAAFSAHKLYGPKGVGALFVRKGQKNSLFPRSFGGGQEKGLRPGTLNVPGIVGFGKACAIAQVEREAESQLLSQWRNYLESELAQHVGVQINGASAPRLPHMTNLTFEGIDGTNLLRMLPNLALSQGAACTSATISPSHVLTAMGHSDTAALSSLRIGLGRMTTFEEVQLAAATIRQAVQQLRINAQ